ncbi:hypothetical protein [Flavobacterium sp.]|uniref:hypothetical protein n=1 Tax=Flavobacterium sp. TaxID=239 RepID=UPI002FDA1062
MKKVMLLFLLTSGVYAQKQVFNVQQYCIDEKPLQQGECDQSGNEYSFVFLDVKKHEVVFYLTDLKFVYQIIDAKTNAVATTYKLKNDLGETEMKVNKAQTSIEFLNPERHVLLTVGKSTKSESKI